MVTRKKGPKSTDGKELLREPLEQQKAIVNRDKIFGMGPNDQQFIKGMPITDSALDYAFKQRIKQLIKAGETVAKNKEAITKRLSMQLDPKEERLIRMRFGLDNKKRYYTLEERARALSLHQSAVVEIEREALLKLALTSYMAYLEEEIQF